GLEPDRPAGGGAGRVLPFRLADRECHAQRELGSHLDARDGVIAGLRLDGFLFHHLCPLQSHRPGMAVFPLVFFITASAAFKPAPTEPALPLFVSAQWIYIHVALILIGYSALLFSFIASILYLIQERSLKSKNISGFWSRLPSLATIDEIGYQCLVWG